MLVFNGLRLEKKSPENEKSISANENHSAEIDSFGAEKGTILRCKIKRIPLPYYSPHRLLPPKKTAPSLLVLTFFKRQAYCNSLPDGNTCCVSARGNSAPRSKSKMTNDKKLISCIQEKKLPNQTVRQTYPVYFSKIKGETPHLIILNMKSIPEQPDYMLYNIKQEAPIPLPPYYLCMQNTTIRWKIP